MYYIIYEIRSGSKGNWMKNWLACDDYGEAQRTQFSFKSNPFTRNVKIVKEVDDA